MIYNVSYNDKRIRREIDATVGQPFSWVERIKMKGNGSPRLLIIRASLEITDLLKLDNNLNYGNIEIRSKGIIIGFRSLLESYAFPIPFYKLTVFKGDAYTYTFYNDTEFVQIKIASPEGSIQKFVKKLLTLKNKNTNLGLERTY